MAPADLRNRRPSSSSGGKTKRKDPSRQSHDRRTKQGTQPIVRPIPEAETLWQTFKSHPLVTIGPYLLFPYLIYKWAFMATLRQPHIFKGLVDLRPAVAMDEMRQVLIIGAIGSGTKQLSEGLAKVMKLEIEHEGMNTREMFTRDGTISNFLGLRYASETYSRERLSSMLSSTCMVKNKASGSAFHLLTYEPSHCWPWPLNNATCHQRACLGFIGREFGCGLKGDGACSTPFARSLHLVRHPVHVLQQLIPKVCPGKNMTSSRAVHPSFRQMASVFLPGDTPESFCVTNLVWYLVEFNRAMVNARQLGHLDAMLQYESLTLCEVARAAGFADPASAVYPPTVDKVQQLCGKDGPVGDAKGTVDANTKLPQLETKTPDQTMRLANLNWEELEKVGGSEMVKALKEICVELGYDVEQPFLAVDGAD